MPDERRQATDRGDTEGEPQCLEEGRCPNRGSTTFVPRSEFPGTQVGSSADNPIHLSDALTEASHSGACPQGVDPDHESNILGHYSDALNEMAQSIMDLEDSYFNALCEVIIETITTKTRSFAS